MSKRRSKVFYGTIMVNGDGGVFFTYDIPDDMPDKLHGEIYEYDEKKRAWVANPRVPKATHIKARRAAMALILRNFALPKPGEKARMKFTIQLED